MIGFKNKFGEIRSGWTIWAVVIIIVIAQLTGSSLVPDNAMEDNVAVISLVTVVYSLIAIGGGLLQQIFGMDGRR
jgi:uncharacterized membrane protein YhaH (DUF805 family)